MYYFIHEKSICQYINEEYLEITVLEVTFYMVSGGRFEKTNIPTHVAFVIALSLCKNVADARFEKTSSSADVFARVPFGIFVFSKLFIGRLFKRNLDDINILTRQIILRGRREDEQLKSQDRFSP